MLELFHYASQCDSKNAADDKSVETPLRRDDREESADLEATIGRESTVSSFSLSFEALEHITAANTRTFLAANKASMSAILASLPAASSASVTTVSETSSTSASTAIKTHIKIL